MRELPAAVLFDMDGTLLDSERVWDVALDELAEALGGRVSPAARTQLVGAPLKLSVPIVHADLGLTTDDPAALAASGRFLLERTAESFSHPLPWKPGAERLLDELTAAGVPMGLVTSTHRRLTELALRTIGADRFATVVCGDEVVRTKPDPESYLSAAHNLALAPQDCVVVEDSPIGLASAYSAGCAVLVVPSEVEIEPRPGITIVKSLLEVDLAHLSEVAAAHRAAGRS